MASNSVWIMEKSRNVQIVGLYMGRTNLCKHCTTDHARGMMKLGIPQQPHSPIAELVTISSAWRVQPYWGQVSSRKPVSMWKARSFKHSKTIQATCLQGRIHLGANGGQARIQVFLGGARTPPPTAVCNIFFIFKPTDVNFPLPFKFHCRIQST